MEWKQTTDSRMHHSRDEQELLSLLPTQLRRALLDEARSPTLLRHPVLLALRDLNLRFFQRLCCECLGSLTCIAGEHIFSFGTVCERMYFATEGHVAYLRYSGVLQAVLSMGAQVALQGNSDFRELYRQRTSVSVQKGCWLAEPVLWVEWTHKGDLDVECQANLLALQCDAFEDFVMSYPAVQLMLVKHAQRFAVILQRAQGGYVGSDLFDTCQMFMIEGAYLMAMAEVESASTNL